MRDVAWRNLEPKGGRDGAAAMLSAGIESGPLGPRADLHRATTRSHNDEVVPSGFELPAFV